MLCFNLTHLTTRLAVTACPAPLLQLSGSDGSYINKADVDVFPVSTNMAGAMMHLAPGATRQMHWHFGIDEWQFVVNGTVEAGVFIKPGVHYEDTLGPGDVGFAPRGSGHWVRNPTDQPAYLVLVFNDGKFTDTELPNFLGTVPAAWTAASLNTTTQMVNSFDYKRTGFALPRQAPTKVPRPARKIGAVPLPATRG
jgi:oxalate decarboxylase